MMNDDADFLTELTTAQRTALLEMVIDPGFVNYRLVETILGEKVMALVHREIDQLPSELPEGLKRGRIDHIYSRAVLHFCRWLPAPSLVELLAAGKGRLFCATVNVAATPAVYDQHRVVSQVDVPGVDIPRVELHYSTSHIHSDTTRMELSQGGEIAIVARLGRRVGEVLVFEPLVMGAPWLTSSGDVPDPLPGGAEWFSYEYFEVFIEDIDEFGKVRGVPAPDNIDILERISERAFKQCLADILGDEAKKDWGGEMSDHFSAHLHLGGRATTGAFILKGPARFAPMGLNSLGKNNDQIYRLSQEPAELLVVQHCHEILPPVRATLRAFAVQPGRARHYCLIDGRDSLRLLQAYGLVDRALELSSHPGLAIEDGGM